jgi:hypothetical protein
MIHAGRNREGPCAPEQVSNPLQIRSRFRPQRCSGGAGPVSGSHRILPVLELARHSVLSSTGMAQESCNPTCPTCVVHQALGHTQIPQELPQADWAAAIAVIQEFHQPWHAWQYEGSLSRQWQFAPHWRPRSTPERQNISIDCTQRQISMM